MYMYWLCRRYIGILLCRRHFNICYKVGFLGFFFWFLLYFVILFANNFQHLLYKNNDATSSTDIGCFMSLFLWFYFLSNVLCIVVTFSGLSSYKTRFFYYLLHKKIPVQIQKSDICQFVWCVWAPYLID